MKLFRWLIEVLKRFNQKGEEGVVMAEQGTGYRMDKLIQELTVDEGRKAFPYKDTKGIWTIGVGHNLEANGLPPHILLALLQRVGLSDAEMDELLGHDIETIAVPALNVVFPEWGSETLERQEVLLNMAFNMGATVFATFKKFWAALRRGDHPDAAVEMMDSTWSGQVGVRADRLRARMVEG